MKTLYKLIIGAVITLTVLVGCLWLARDDFFASYLEETVASRLNIVVKVDQFKSRPFKGLLQWRIEASGTVEGTPFAGEAQVSLFPLQILKHKLKVTRFPLQDLNVLTKKRWNFEFARGWTSINSWGSIHRDRISVRAKLHLQEIEMTGDGKPAGLAGDENLLNMLVHVTGIPVDIQIEGDPRNPQITWKRELPASINMMKNIFGPLFKQFQTPPQTTPQTTPKNKPPSEAP